MPVLKVIYSSKSQYAQRGIPKYHDEEALETVITYCQNPSKTASGLVGGFGVNVSQAAYEMDLLAHAYGKNKGLRLRHWVISFDKGEISRLKRAGYRIYDTLANIAWYAASYYGYQYQIVYAVHKDSNQPHIHFVMNTVNFKTGHKYAGDKADYFAYQKYLTEFLQQYGMDLKSVPDQPQNSLPFYFDKATSW